MPTRSLKRKEAIPAAEKPTDEKYKEPKNGPQPATLARIERAAELIGKGKTKSEIIAIYQKDYNISYDQARRYYICGCRYLIPDDQEGYRRALIQSNVERLEKIIDECMKDNANLRVAKEAISELNRMLGLGGGGVTIKNDNENKTQEITVNFG